MIPSRRMIRLKKYGADLERIDEQFHGDEAQYEEQLRQMLRDPDFDILEKNAGNAERMRLSAQALAVWSERLGLTPLTQDIQALIQAVDQKDDRKIQKQCVSISRQRSRLTKMMKEKPSRWKTGDAKKDRTIRMTVLILLSAVILVCILFSRLISSYKNSTMQESAAHLREINQELQLYVEARIQDDWNATHSIENSITNAHMETDEEILAYLRQERDIWGVSSITVYTDSGYSIDTNGIIGSSETASVLTARVKESGEYLTIQESDIKYVVPDNGTVQINGSRIAAVSVVQRLSSFLDNMNISSFQGTACVYLTQKNGAVVSKLSHMSSESVYNLISLLEESTIQSLSENYSSLEDLITSEDTTVFLRRLASGDQYVVSSLIKTGYEEMRLFYFVPVSAVNQTTDSFSRYIVLLSITMIVAFSVASIFLFLSIYRSRRKQFDEAISVREQMLDLLVQNTGSAFALLNENQNEPFFVSSNAQKIIGEEYYNIRKTKDGWQMHNSTGTGTEAVNTINEQMKSWDGNSEFRSAFLRNHASAVPAYFEIQVFPVKDRSQDGDFVAIAQDVTSLYKRQQATEDALAMAEQANQAKSRFLSSMSHDIRTPMNAIINMTDFAKESIGDPEKQKEYLDSLSESSRHLLDLINNVLDMSRIESGRMTVASEPFDLMAELRQISDIIRPLCQAKNQTFTADFSRMHNTSVRGDSVKLSQILMNLLSNANKFTPENGAILFTAEDIPSLRKDIADIRFRVTDNGTGISRRNLKKIFEPFARVENSEAEHVEATGLGLSICRSYVSAMSGTIQCDSELGRGSTFTVELFFRKTEKAAETHAEAPLTEKMPFKGKRCLLCEDNEINQRIAEKLLQGLGFEVELAADGKEGTEKFFASRPGYYDLIYMDIQMPVMDGYQATETIRASRHPQAKTIPIIAMTANVFAEDVEKARIAGMNSHIGKPILVADLIRATDQVLKGKQS